MTEIHEIRNKARKASNKGYQSIAHRFTADAAFRSSQEELGRTIETMREWDRLAAAPSVVHGIPYQERVRRFGTRSELVLTSTGSGTHRIYDAPNYQEVVERGPPTRPPSPEPDPAKGKGKRKGKGAGRAHSNPQHHHRRSSQSDSWHPYQWQQQQRWWW